MVLFGLYDPVPPLHVAVVAAPPMEPARVTFGEPEQTACARPELTVAPGLTITVTVKLAPVHVAVAGVTV